MNEHMRNLSIRVPKPAPKLDPWPKALTLNEVADDAPNSDPPLRIYWSPGIRDLRRAAAKHFGLTIADIISTRHLRDLVRARHIAMYLARQITSFSFPMLAKHFGDRDHTTVMHACRKIELRLKDGDQKLAADVEAVRQLALKMDPALAGGSD